VGAYISAIMMDRWNINYAWTIPVAGLLCLIVGFVFGRPALRLEGLYLALATFSLALAVPQILKYFEHWTGGSQGIVLTKPKAPWGLKITEDQWLYLVTFAITVVMFILAANLVRSRVGRAMVAIRDNHIAGRDHGRGQRALQVAHLRRERRLYRRGGGAVRHRGRLCGARLLQRVPVRHLPHRHCDRRSGVRSGVMY
jgi:ABC-type branched-subunit amino acid transport system permease subunit